MTAAEWAACADPQDLLDAAEDRASDRHLRLIGSACARRVWHVLSPAMRACVEANERFADGAGNAATLDALVQGVVAEAEADGSGDAARNAAAAAVESVAFVRSSATYFALYTLAGVAAEAAFDGEAEWHARRDAEFAAQAEVVRDVLGPPGRPVVAPADWLTANVVGVAEAIHAGRAYDRLPVLADALEDAGCADADLLAHCRSGGPHAPGCWAVDLVLGRR